MSIPGNPLPPVSPESVKAAIPIYEAILKLPTLSATQRARGVGYLATLYSAIGDDEQAERLYSQALAQLGAAGVSGEDLGWVHNNRGLSARARGRYDEAAGAFEAALAALSRDGSRPSEPRVIVQQNLASTYHALDDFEPAETAYLEARAELRALGEQHGRIYQTTSHNLALLYSSMGDFAAARKLLESLLASGVEEPGLRLIVLNDLGHALTSTGDFAAAANRLREALALTPPDGAERVLVMVNLALACGYGGDLATARGEGEEALRLADRVYGHGSEMVASAEGTLAWVVLRQGDVDFAEQLLESARRVVGERYLRLGGGPFSGLDEGLAIVALRRGNRSRAIELASRGFARADRDLERILAFGSEAQRLAHQSNSFPYDCLAEVGDPTLLADAVLRTKGAVLESLLAERTLARRSTDPRQRERLDRIHTLRLAAMERVARGGADDDAELEAIQRALKQDEMALAKAVGLRQRYDRAAMDVARVRAALASGEALVELVRFRRLSDAGRLLPIYGAVIVPQRGAPAWIELGAAGEIEPLVAELAQRMEALGGAKPSASGGRGTIPLARTRTSDRDVAPLLRELHRRLWKPIATAFPASTRRVILSPDGELHFVPWPALLSAAGDFVAERWQIVQVATGRDLLRPTTPPVEKTLLALADGASDLGFAAREVETLEGQARERGWSSVRLAGDAATEAALAAHPHPAILHFATHGGQLDGELAAAVGARLGRAPMYRGFLMLGGARRGLAAWRRGAVLGLDEDGLLTAEEAAGLDLQGTWLTVLSACQTGLGEARSGEGVLGLRRGFALAGSRHLLFTLWSVDDEATAELMRGFYARLFRSMDPASALNEVQRSELRRLADGGDHNRAVYAVAGFVLSR
ncbi:MAG TPA: CHAT domain-containing tetratricopeptide repeat protein [Thermoanaerobaculia bacterium]|nr:CHAT domain-containing tetratricopeptide repeat protein [Thermoanaerobaculia bacterium]